MLLCKVEESFFVWRINGASICRKACFKEGFQRKDESAQLTKRGQSMRCKGQSGGRHNGRRRQWAWSGRNLGLHALEADILYGNFIA